MPLTIKFRDGRYCPTVVCDHCAEEITDAADGNYHWRIGLNDTDFGKQIYFTHKRCCDPFEVAHKGELFMWGAMELQCFPIYLGHNMAIKWGAAVRLAAILSM